jgi:hypothetical protein
MRGIGVSKLSRLWDWLLPGLIYLDPMVATACFQAVIKDETSNKGSASARRPVLVSESLGAGGMIALVDVPQPAPVGS